MKKDARNVILFAQNASAYRKTNARHVLKGISLLPQASVLSLYVKPTNGSKNQPLLATTAMSPVSAVQDP